MKKCPFCAELIQDEAIKCRYCGSMLTNGPPPAAGAGDDRMWLQDVRNLILQGQKIDAIKRVRLQTGAGLKDAKDFVDAMERGQSPAVPPAAVRPPQSVGCALLVAAIFLGVLAALVTFFLRR